MSGRGTANEKSGGAPWLTARTACVLLLLFVAAMTMWMWGQIMKQAFLEVEPTVKMRGYDFYQYYAAGDNFNLGLDPYVNHPEAPHAMQHPMGLSGVVDGYLYPPTLLPLYGALARAPYNSSHARWLAAGVMAFLLTVTLAAALLRERRLEFVTAVLLLLVASFPGFYVIHQGQIDLLVSCLAICGFLLYPRWRGWPTAALFALAIVAKVSPVLVLLALVAYSRDWRLLLKTLACVAALVALSLAWVEPGLYGKYVTDVLPAVSTSQPVANNQSLTRFFTAVPQVARLISIAGYASLVALVYVIGRAGRRQAPRDLVVSRRVERHGLLLLSVAFLLLFSPLSWPMGYVWAIVPVALLVVAAVPRTTVWAPVVIGAAGLLMQGQYRVTGPLTVVNMSGALLAVAALLLLYLPPLAPGVGAWLAARRDAEA